MTVNTWCNWIKYVLSNVLFLRQFSNCLLIFISEFNDLFITKSFHIICFNNSFEDWEAMLDISKIIKLININSCDFNFISRSRRINQIKLDYNFFLSRDSTRRDRAWCFLYGPFLIIAIFTFAFFQIIRTSVLATCTNSQYCNRIFKIIMK